MFMYWQQFILVDKLLPFLFSGFVYSIGRHIYDSEAKSVVHIGLLEYTLLNEYSGFYAVNKLINVNGYQKYSDNIALHVVNLSRIDLATEDNKQYRFDEWATFTFADINTLMCIESAAIRRIMEDGKVIVKRETAASENDGNKVIDVEQDVKIMVSGVIRRDDRTFARVIFMRGTDWAEGIVPDGTIGESEGFTQEEITQLEDYLAREKDMLISQAKDVNPLRNMLGM